MPPVGWTICTIQSFSLSPSYAFIFLITKPHFPGKNSELRVTCFRFPSESSGKAGIRIQVSLMLIPVLFTLAWQMVGSSVTFSVKLFHALVVELTTYASGSPRCPTRMSPRAPAHFLGSFYLYACPPSLGSELLEGRE